MRFHWHNFLLIQHAMFGARFTAESGFIHIYLTNQYTLVTTQPFIGLHNFLLVRGSVSAIYMLRCIINFKIKLFKRSVVNKRFFLMWYKLLSVISVSFQWKSRQNRFSLFGDTAVQTDGQIKFKKIVLLL